MSDKVPWVRPERSQAPDRRRRCSVPPGPVIVVFCCRLVPLAREFRSARAWPSPGTSFLSLSATPFHCWQHPRALPHLQLASKVGYPPTKGEKCGMVIQERWDLITMSSPTRRWAGLDSQTALTNQGSILGSRSLSVGKDHIPAFIRRELQDPRPGYTHTAFYLAEPSSYTTSRISRVVGNPGLAQEGPWLVDGVVAGPDLNTSIKPIWHQTTIVREPRTPGSVGDGGRGHAPPRC